MAEMGDQDGGQERSLEEAMERPRHAEADRDHGRADHRKRSYELIVNRKAYTWPYEKISGSQIKALAGSPADWAVNQIVEGPGEDPEIGDDQFVDLALDAEPKGVKRFTTRKPKTSPGSR